MPRGVPKTKTDASRKSNAKTGTNPDPELDKLKKELEEAKAKLAEVATQVPQEVEEAQAAFKEGVTYVPPAKPKGTVDKKIPVLSVPGKVLEVTEYGYDFENIHISKDVPVNVIAQGFVERLGDPPNKNLILDEFDVPQGFLNEYALHLKKHRIRVRNGVITYGVESWPIPAVSPEVFLRILEDRLKTDQGINRYFSGVNSARKALALTGVVKAIKKLIEPSPLIS